MLQFFLLTCFVNICCSWIFRLTAFHVDGLGYPSAVNLLAFESAFKLNYCNNWIDTSLVTMQPSILYEYVCSKKHNIFMYLYFKYLIKGMKLELDWKNLIKITFMLWTFIFSNSDMKTILINSALYLLDRSRRKQFISEIFRPGSFLINHKYLSLNSCFSGSNLSHICTFIFP